MNNWENNYEDPFISQYNAICYIEDTNILIGICVYLKSLGYNVCNAHDPRALYHICGLSHTSRPHFSIEQIVRRLKMVSTRRLFNSNENYFRSFYWKKRQIWSGGYFCSTVGEVSEDKVSNYIKNQG